MPRLDNSRSTCLTACSKAEAQFRRLNRRNRQGSGSPTGYGISRVADGQPIADTGG